MRYTTSDRSAVSPDNGSMSYPLDHPEVRSFLDSGGEIGEPLIEISDDREYIRDVERAEIVNEALDMLKREARAAIVTEARNARPDLFSNTDSPQTVSDPMGEGDELEALRARVAELEAREPVVVETIVEVEKIVHVEVPAAVVEPEASEPYTPDFTLIPDALASFAQADESAAEFRARLKRLWQRFGIADGEHFPGGGEPLTGEEKITMREIDIVLNSDEGKNAGLLDWLRAEERP